MLMRKRLRLSIASAAWLLLGTAQGVPETPPGDPPVRLTSDTIEYCHDLEAKLHATLQGMTSPPPRAVVLSTEGGKLCAKGLVRGGITRLRSAMLILLRSETALPGPR